MKNSTSTRCGDFGMSTTKNWCIYVYRCDMYIYILCSILDIHPKVVDHQAYPSVKRLTLHMMDLTDLSVFFFPMDLGAGAKGSGRCAGAKS